MAAGKKKEVKIQFLFFLPPIFISIALLLLFMGSRIVFLMLFYFYVFSMMILHYMDFYGIVVMEHYIKRKQ